MLGNSTVFKCSLRTGYPTPSGLMVFVSGGQLTVSGSIVIIDTVLMSIPSRATSYIFVNLTTGTIQSNTTGFATGGIYPVAIVITSSNEVITLIDARPDVFSGTSGGGGGSVDSTQAVSTSQTVGFLGASNTLISATAGASGVTLTLPDATFVPGQIMRFVQVDTGVGGVLLQPVNGQTISGLSSYVLTNQWQCVQIQSNSSNWTVIASN